MKYLCLGLILVNLLTLVLNLEGGLTINYSLTINYIGSIFSLIGLYFAVRGYRSLNQGDKNGI